MISVSNTMVLGGDAEDGVDEVANGVRGQDGGVF